MKLSIYFRFNFFFLLYIQPIPTSSKVRVLVYLIALVCVRDQNNSQLITTETDVILFAIVLSKFWRVPTTARDVTHVSSRSLIMFRFYTIRKFFSTLFYKQRYYRNNYYGNEWFSQSFAGFLNFSDGTGK